MTKKIVSATAVLIGAGSLLFGCSFEQATAGCIVQDHPSWLAFYERDESTALVGTCTEDSAALDLDGDYEPVGIFKYVNPDDRSDAKLAIRPAGLASRGARDTSTTPYEQNALGKMNTTPDAEDFCEASEFSEAIIRDPGDANPTSGDPEDVISPTNISYQFENMKVLAAPNAPGTWAKGSLTYTRDGCTVKYNVSAIWPPVPCDPDAEAGTRNNCGPDSGANQDFNLVCHRDADGAHYCKPDLSKPVFKTQE